MNMCQWYFEIIQAVAAEKISNLSPRTTHISGSKSLKASENEIIANPIDLEIPADESEDNKTSIFFEILKLSFSITLYVNPNC